MRRLRVQDSTFEADREQGYVLLAAVVAIAIILIMLSVAASKVAFTLRREREVESARRADQYVRAIRKFYLKNQRYPGNVDQLENTNLVRYLRQRYVDPLTGKPDYRLIPVGQNKTTVKGFFGQELAGLPTAGLGAAAGMQSSGMPGSTTMPGSNGSAFGSSGLGSSTFGGGTGASPVAGGAAGGVGGIGTGGAGATGTTDTTNGTQGTSGLGSAAGMQSSGMPGSTGPIMGVGSSASGPSILVINEQTTYDTWEFLYDPRLEKLRLAGQLNAGAGSLGASSLGTTPGAFGSTNPPGGFGSASPGGGFGSASPGGGFGSTSAGGAGGTTSGGSGSAPTTQP